MAGVERASSSSSPIIPPDAEGPPKTEGGSPAKGPEAARNSGQVGTQAGNTVEPHEPRRYCVDNGFHIDGGNAHPEPAGSAARQAYQATLLASHTAAAAESHVSGGHLPDFLIARNLNYLSPSPPVPGTKAEHTEYSSHLEGVSAKDGFEYFTQHPNELFGSVGITLRPCVTELKDGARLFLEEPGMTPPVWAPIEVHLDEKNHRVMITTLDGHPLRGTNNFQFTDDGKGGSSLRQVSDFQLSSVAVQAGAAGSRAAAEKGIPGFQDPIDRQHQIWSGVHAHLSDHAIRDR